VYLASIKNPKGWLKHRIKGHDFWSGSIVLVQICHVLNWNLITNMTITLPCFPDDFDKEQDKPVGVEDVKFDDKDSRIFGSDLE
jgi:hypothetical protein